MKHWSEIVHQLNQQNCPYVLVTILGVRGSAPRDSSTKMIITKQQNYNTIGGGRLEFMVIEQARNMLKAPQTNQHIEYYPLGTKLGQCCGGSTSVLFEYFSPQYIETMLFGAGHVGEALSKILLELPLKLHWVDNRDGQFPVAKPLDNTTTNCRTIISSSPVKEVIDMPANGYYLIMTHDHQLDFELCCAILERNDAQFIGLIGSKTKWLRFQKRLSSAGFSEQQINRIQCPIGLTDVPGKRPMEVAVSIAGAIIADYQKNAHSNSLNLNKAKQQGLQWSQLAKLEVANNARKTQRSTERKTKQTLQTCGGCDDCK